MTPNTLVCGDAVSVMRGWPDGSVNCVVTSPPYWGLRSYAGEQERVWSGADGCEHEWADETFEAITGTGGNWQQAENGPGLASGKHQTRFKGDVNAAAVKERTTVRRGFCLRCGAWRGALGLEPTPEMYVEHIVQVFREVRRVLHPRGTLWLNMGDSYAGSGGAGGDYNAGGLREGQPRYPGRRPAELKPKDLCLMPARVALALQADGWWLRSVIIWDKPNPMPESVTDRPTTSHEYVFLLAKSDHYWWDAEAVREPHDDRAGPVSRFGNTGSKGGNAGGIFRDGDDGGARPSFPLATGGRVYHPAGRNLRTVWRIPTQPYSGAHFATFPLALASRCLLAGCPPKVCAVCGEPWARRVDRGHRVMVSARGAYGSGGSTPDDSLIRAGAVSEGRMRRGWAYENRDLGLFPTCSCGGQTRAGIALDPFMGSGTVALAALQLGRTFLGIEISEAYCKLAEARIAGARSQQRLGLEV